MIEQLIDLENVKTENLNFRINLRDRVMRWLVCNTVDDCLQSQIAQKKIFISKIEACPVNAGNCMAFKHLISFATYLAANFGCNRLTIMPDIISKLLRAAM